MVPGPGRPRLGDSNRKVRLPSVGPAVLASGPTFNKYTLPLSSADLPPHLAPLPELIFTHN